jgi:hypothetical protein
MVYRGQIQNGVVVFQGNLHPPEGTLVEVQPLKTVVYESLEDPIYNIGELAVSTGISDLSQNIDHYLYGHPKKEDDSK